MTTANSPFAYILTSTIWSAEFHNEIKKQYWGGVIEALISCEEQWVEYNDLWPFGWHEIMSRNTVVQITSGLDPRENILTAFKNQGIEPLFRQELDNEKDHIIYFDKIIDSSQLTSNKIENIKTLSDFKQFHNVFQSTISLCKQESRGLLFIGGKGFSCDITTDNEEQIALREQGFSVTNRQNV